MLAYEVFGHRNFSKLPCYPRKPSPSDWMLLHMLSLEMDGKSWEMEQATRNYLMMRNILDLAATSKGNPGQVIAPFFMQIKQKVAPPSNCTRKEGSCSK